MRQVTSNKIYSVEEYIQHEWSAAMRSEFINGRLFEMAEEKDINNAVGLKLAFLLMQFLTEKRFQIYAHDVKVKIFNADKYYYPDVFVTKEPETEENQYIKNEPVLIVEVVAESSQVTDYVDKYIDHRKIPSLLYYLIVEPETSLITCYTKSEKGDWQTVKFTKPADIINLEQLNVSFSLKQIYE